MKSQHDIEDERYSALYKSGTYNPTSPTALIRYASPEIFVCRRILDAGCGRRPFEKSIRAMGYDGKITNVDVASYLAEQNAKVICAPLDKLPFWGGTFDGLFCCRVLEHIHEQNDMLLDSLLEMRRVLVPSGFWVFWISLYESLTFKELHVTIQEKEWWLAMLEKCGFISYEFDLMQNERELFVKGKS